MDKLPSEIIINIFQSIDSTRTLARCRQVNKLWNATATAAMFERAINISYIQQAWKFYDFLLMNMSSGKLPKSLYFGHLGVINVELKRRILKLVFTQSTERIQGYHCCDDFYLDMMDIAESNLNGKYSLKAIPHPATHTSIHYKEAVAIFKESLQDVYLNAASLKDANAVAYLTQFRNLTSFGVDLHNADMLNTLLNITVELAKIEEMTLYISSTHNSSNTLINELEGLGQQQSITTSTIKRLRVITDLQACSKLIMPHFSNLRSIEVYLEDDIDGIDEQFFIDTINLLKTVLHYTFEFSINDRYVTL